MLSVILKIVSTHQSKEKLMLLNFQQQNHSHFPEKKNHLNIEYLTQIVYNKQRNQTFSFSKISFLWLL